MLRFSLNGVRKIAKRFWNYTEEDRICFSASRYIFCISTKGGPFKFEELTRETEGFSWEWPIDEERSIDRLGYVFQWSLTRFTALHWRTLTHANNATGQQRLKWPLSARILVRLLVGLHSLWFIHKTVQARASLRLLRRFYRRVYHRNLFARAVPFAILRN